MGGNEYLPPRGGETHRAMCRCKVCKAWWSSDDPDGQTCGCGGELETVDMAEHAKTLPRAPYDASKDPKRK